MHNIFIYIYLACIVVGCVATLTAIGMVALINRRGYSQSFSTPFVYRNSVSGRRIAVVRILVVDDNPSVRRHLRGILEQHAGWQVCGEAGTGQEAVERFRQGRPDVIVLDFQMPEMNGLDAARIISHLSPKTPILMLSLYLSQQLREAARKVGIRGACAKTNISSVVDAIGALLRKETYFPS
jgi:CheY-like chemotaxis protein